MPTARLVPVPPAVVDAGLLVARVILGAILIAHGWQKVAQNGLEATGGAFAEMGVPLPQVAAVFTAVAELGGGILLVLGLLTQVAGLAVVFVMVGAWFFVHRDNGVFVTGQGWELVAAIGLAAAMFVVVGPGRASIDALLARRRGTARDEHVAAERVGTGSTAR
ncbi:DoxX family protein [Mobilicoccus massiliensis]|uniref:DoxX family protein n=1 Tax=Mobilicoccus massiliensis TaxID=1522310 RepID=UPI00058D5E98|nr:DoxX family protein [Mobilicoccus massiliensis]